MDNSTKKLLEECSVGCKMGIESMEQVQHHVTDAKIAATIEKSCSKHKELEEEISKILLRAGQPARQDQRVSGFPLRPVRRGSPRA